MYEWSVGDIIQGRWEILLGPFSGGFGSVYIVRDLQSEKYAYPPIQALKVPHRHSMSNKNLMEQFEREAYIWQSLGQSCKLIVSPYHFIRIQGRPVLIMEAIITQKYSNNLGTTYLCDPT